MAITIFMAGAFGAQASCVGCGGGTVTLAPCPTLIPTILEEEDLSDQWDLGSTALKKEVTTYIGNCQIVQTFYGFDGSVNYYTNTATGTCNCAGSNPWDPNNWPDFQLNLYAQTNSFSALIVVSPITINNLNVSNFTVYNLDSKTAVLSTNITYTPIAGQPITLNLDGLLPVGANAALAAFVPDGKLESFSAFQTTSNGITRLPSIRTFTTDPGAPRLNTSVALIGGAATKGMVQLQDLSIAFGTGTSEALLPVVTNGVAISAGATFAVNQVTHNGNDINDPSFLEVPSAFSDPNGVNNLQLLAWNGAGFDNYYYFNASDATAWEGVASVAGWYNSAGTLADVTWNPGVGMVFVNPTTASGTLLLHGAMAVAVFPFLPNGCGQFNLIGLQTNNTAGTFQNVTGLAPQEGDQVLRHVAGQPANPILPPNYTVYTYSGGAWSPSTPILNPGEAAWFYVPCVAAACVPPPANVALWLPFDETGGTTSLNLAPGGNNGTQVNGPTVNLGGYVANSLNFNGANQYVTVPDYPAIDPGTGDLSIDAWVKRAAGAPNSPPSIIVDKRDASTIIGYSLSLSYGELICELSDPSGYTNYRDTNGVVPADNKWHLVAVTVSRSLPSGGRFYVDGVLTTVFDPTGQPGNLSTMAPFLVGASPVGGNTPWLGGIDEVEFFHRTLTATEVKGIYNAGAFGKCKPTCVSAPANLALWLPLDEISGTTSINLAPGANNGTQVNGPTVNLGGYVANSLNFNGANQYVSVPDYPAINPGAGQNFTVDAWVSRAVGGPDSPPSIILDKRDPNTGIGYSLSVSYGNLIFQLADAGGFQNFASLAAVPPDGNWHFVAVSVIRNQTNGGQFYVDGVATAVFDPTGQPGSLANTSPFQVGASVVGGNQPWNGGIDEVEMFKRALTASEIQGIYSAGSFGKCKPTCVTPPASLGLWLPFDETSGTISINLASGGNNGTQINNPTVNLGGYVANSLSFNGSQSVTVPDYPAIDPGTGDLSIDAWVKRAAGAPDSPPSIIVDKRDANTTIGYSLSLSYGELICELSDPSGYTNYRDTNGMVPADNNWHLVAVTVSRNSTSGGRFYVDGVLTTVFDPTGQPGSLSTTAPFVVGASPVYGNTPWLGGLDEVEFFHRALTASEIQGIYNAGSFGKCRPTCVNPPANIGLWLPLDETGGTTSANLVPGGNNGTQINSPTVNVGGYVGNSLSFNGANQSVTVPDYPAIDPGTNDLSIDAWVKRAAGAPNSPPSIIVDKRDANTTIGYSLSLSYGELICELSDPSGYTNYRDTNGVVPADNNWHLVAVTVIRNQPNGGRFYVDGVLTTVFNPTGQPGSLSTTAPFVVGASPVGGNTPWLGAIDEVEFFRRALTAGEIQGIFNAGAFGKCKSPCSIPVAITAPANKTAECGTAWRFNLPSVLPPLGCSNVTITVLSTVTNGICPKLVTRTWLITDCCGGSNTCSQTVTLVDTTPPVITCQTNTLIVALNTNCQLVVPVIQASATDSCTPISQLHFTQSPLAGTIVLGHSQTVVVTVTDACGNSSHCLVNVYGLDKTGPVLTGPRALAVTNCAVPNAFLYVTAMDNCCPTSQLHYSQSPLANTPLGPGITSVTVTVTDCNGNTTTKVIPLNLTGNESFLNVLYNTGVDASKVPLVLNGATDSHYTLGPVPAGTTGYVLPNAVAITSLWGWLEPIHFSEWIAPDLNYIYSCPAGFYTYTNQFVLPAGVSAGTASISGRWAADDGAQMYFNGVLQGANTIPVQAYPYQQSGFNHWHPFTISGGFVASPAKNTILFVVTNSINYNPSPTGLRVEYTNALVNCYTCAPSVIVSMTGSQLLPAGSLAAFHVNASGTPGLTYQWYHNGVPLANNGHDFNVTAATLLVFPLSYADAGVYSVVVNNPCGSGTGKTLLRVIPGWPWSWGWWNVAQLDNPLAAAVGPDLTQAGPNAYALATGTTEDFGLPDPGGQVVNVLDVPPLPAGAAIQVPVIAPTGSNAINCYSLIMDIYEPDTSLGTPSTLFRNSCCLGSTGQDGVDMTLDTSNVLHLTAYAAGVAYDLASPAPLPVDAWNRVAGVIDDPQDGLAVTLSLYNDGQLLGSLSVPTASGLPINWNNSAPSLLSRQTNDLALNGEFYVSSVQFHSVALSPGQIAGIGSPDTGLPPANDPSVGPQPVLAAALANGNVSFSWTGSPFVLQETSSLIGNNWTDSALSFTETLVNGSTVTTATVSASTSAPSKFYRLVFRP